MHSLQQVEHRLQPLQHLTGNTIKIISCIAMLIQHLCSAVLLNIAFKLQISEKISLPLYERLVLIDNSVIEGIGSIAFPMFCFLLVEGFLYTRNRKGYLGRLMLFALLSELPFDLGLFSDVSKKQGTFPIYAEHQNVIFTLFLGILCLSLVDGIRTYTVNYLPQSFPKKELGLPGYLGLLLMLFVFSKLANTQYGGYGIYILCAFCFVTFVCGVGLYGFSRSAKPKWMASLLLQSSVIMAVAIFAESILHTDYGSQGIFLIVGLYLTRKHRLLQVLVYLLLFNGVHIVDISLFFFLIPPVLMILYSGTRGKLHLKYAFYWFYPVHLLLLYFLNNLLQRLV